MFVTPRSRGSDGKNEGIEKLANNRGDEKKIKKKKEDLENEDLEILWSHDSAKVLHSARHTVPLLFCHPRECILTTWQ